MKQTQQLRSKIDFKLFGSMWALIVIGWLTIYSAGYDSSHPWIFDVSKNYGKTFIWIIICILLNIIILNINSKVFSVFSYIYYIISILSLVLVYFIADDVKGARAWIDFGYFKFQPSEFAKLSTALALSNYMSDLDVTFNQLKTYIVAFALIFIPMGLVLAQHDMGSALVFLSFFFLLHRFGMASWILYSGIYLMFITILSLFFKPYMIAAFLMIILAVWLYRNRTSKEFKNFLTLSIISIVLTFAFTTSVEFIISKMDKHQRDRINVMAGKGGNDWNVRQSLIAIGSGQFIGKGYLNGTQSKGNFLPAKETDFIFCTIGEEFGFVGTILFLILFVYFMMRIINQAEKQKSNYAKIYGYAIVSIMAFHFFINIGMSLGLLPVIGIPLPFMSYGGTSLVAFTILVTVFIRMDIEKWILS